MVSGDQKRPIWPFDRVMGRFRFAPSPKFVEKQEDIFAKFHERLLERASGEPGGIDVPQLSVSARPKDPDWTLVIDVRTEPLLFNVDAEDVAFLLNESNELSLLATYTESLIQAVDGVLGERKFVSFEVRSTQIVDLKAETKNYDLMNQLLPGVTTAKGLFGHVPNATSKSYKVQRTDAKWTVCVGDEFEYIFDLEAPANEQWSKLWFSFLVRTASGKVGDANHLSAVEDTIRRVIDGQTFLQAFCGDDIRATSPAQQDKGSP